MLWYRAVLIDLRPEAFSDRQGPFRHGYMLPLRAGLCVKAPHQVGPGGWKVKHGPQPPHKGPPPHHGKGPPPPPPKPAPHKKPPKPKPPPKPKKTHAHKKPRQLSPGSDVACCSAQAVGMLLGWDWEQVLELYWRTASDPCSGASILDTLLAIPVDKNGLQIDFAQVSGLNPVDMILGISLPEPHAIAVTPDGTWWSWGQPFNPDGWPELVIEEAWCLR